MLIVGFGKGYSNFKFINKNANYEACVFNFLTLNINANFF